MAEKEEPKLRVVKTEEEPNEENKLGKPTEEEVAQYKIDFDNAIKNFAETRWPVSDIGAFSANDIGMFLMDFLKKYVLWTKTGWMGVIKMQEELTKAIKMDNEKTGLTLDYQTLEFCGYMLMNPGGIGFEAAVEFEKIADKYSKLMIEVGKKVEDAREKLKATQYLQDKWAAGMQGFYLAELEPKKEETPEEPEGKVIEMKVTPKEETTEEA
jgi:hypothetical protein